MRAGGWKTAHMSQPIAGASEDGTSAVSNSILPPVNQHDTGPVAGDPAVHGKSCTLIQLLFRAAGLFSWIKSCK
jgi:hypothetical protein